MKKLQPDETVASVWSHLTYPREYVAGARSNMLLCHKEHGNAHIRIGITGTGQKPYYRIFHICADQDEVIFNSYYDNHRELEAGHALTQNWSSASMSLDQVSLFLADKVGWTGKIR